MSVSFPYHFSIFSVSEFFIGNSRIHPDFYDLAHKNTSDMDNTYFFLMQLINEEKSNPFSDRRLDYKIPDANQVFEMVTKETIDSLYLNLIVSVIVRNVIADVLIVHLKDSDLECYIGW